MKEFFDSLFKVVGQLLEKLFIENPTAAAWAIAFLAACYGLYKLTLYTRGLQEKLDASATAREIALNELQKAHDIKIAQKDQEIAIINEKFHEHITVATNAFVTVNNTLHRTNAKPWLNNCHNGIFAIGIKIGMAPHELNMPSINEVSTT